MATSTPMASILDREFLGIRSRLIDLAASLDRIGRAEGCSAADSRLQHIRRSLEILLSKADNRAEQIQREFSLPYEDDWRSG